MLKYEIVMPDLLNSPLTLSVFWFCFFVVVVVHFVFKFISSLVLCLHIYYCYAFFFH